LESLLRHFYMWRSKILENVPRLFRVANGKTEASLFIGQGSHVVERDGDAPPVSQALIDCQALFSKLQGPGIAALAVVDGADVAHGVAIWAWTPRRLKIARLFSKNPKARV